MGAQIEQYRFLQEPEVLGREDGAGAAGSRTWVVIVFLLIAERVGNSKGGTAPAYWGRSAEWITPRTGSSCCGRRRP
jgi:hypothetical protein